MKSASDAPENHASPEPAQRPDELRNVSAELRASEDRYRSLVEASPTAIMAIRDGRFIYMNPAGARLLGFADPQEAMGQDAIKVIAPGSREQVVERLSRLAKGQSNPQAEIELLRPDGSVVVAESTSIVIKLHDGPAALILAQDVTERKQKEAELKRHSEFQDLVSRISTKFVGLTGAEFEQAIQDALAEIGGYFGSDTVRLYRLSLQGDVVKIRNMWRDEHLAPPKEMAEIHKMKYPNLAAHYSRGEATVFSRFDDSPSWPEMRKILRFFGTKAGVGVPLECDSTGIDVFAMDKVLSEHVWPKDVVEQSKAIGKVILSAMRRREAEVALQGALSNVKQLKEQLEAENVYLREKVRTAHGHEDIVGSSDVMRSVLEHVAQVAPTDSTVLITGETGTGKELLARAIHRLSNRSDRPFVVVNCAAMAATLIENELFGREKGAYTGALTRQIGRFEVADGGTIFLDEVGELSPEVQVKLLRVLEEGEFERLGSTKSIRVDVRVVAATNRNLVRAVQEKTFRKDFYYRLNVFPITVPPLRERREDIPALIWFFVGKLSERMGKSIEAIPQKAMEALQAYPWPGNVRELRNIIERSMILTSGRSLAVQLPACRDLATERDMTLGSVQKQHILEVLAMTGWQVSGRGGAAEILGLKPTTLEARMAKLGIKRPK